MVIGIYNRSRVNSPRLWYVDISKQDETDSLSQVCFSLLLRPAPLLGQFIVSRLTDHPGSEHWHLSIPKVSVFSFQYFIFNSSNFPKYVHQTCRRREVTAGLAFNRKFSLFEQFCQYVVYCRTQTCHTARARWYWKLVNIKL